MANISFYTSQVPDQSPAAITQGTQAPSAGDIEVRISTTNSPTKEEIRLALERIWNYLVDPGLSANPFL